VVVVRIRGERRRQGHGRAPGWPPWNDGAMSQPDDIDKLLREIDAMNAGQGAALPAPAQKAAIEPAATSSGGSGRVAWTGASAVGGLLAGGVVGTVLTFLPYVSTASTAVGAALGAALAGFVSGPPAWFHKD
jgi:hypothetical protein